MRTHTSPVQIRHMLANKPPIRVIAPGRTYRSDSDMTHTPMFHQVEGLVIDETTHMGHLKGCLRDFVEAFFQVDDVPMRFRPSYFPFTAPSMEVDIGCSFEGGQLKIGGGHGWLEILGSGMVHPRVLKNGGIDPDKYQGFAFRHGHRSRGDAEIRHSRSQEFLRRRPPVAAPLWFRRSRHADALWWVGPMKITFDWLKRHLETDASVDDIADALNRIGLEVDHVADRARELEPFIVGYVVEAKQHPNADKLRVCLVDNGTETVQVVCGAPNARTGMKGVFAASGLTIPGTGMKLKPSEIRGEPSNGMLCSEREMGLPTSMTVLSSWLTMRSWARRLPPIWAWTMRCWISPSRRIAATAWVCGVLRVIWRRPVWAA